MLGPPTPRRIDEPIAASLDDLVPPDHVYRHLNRTLDLAFVRDLVCGPYAGIGRPSIDPVVVFTLQLLLFFEGLRSERQLLRGVADRLSWRWYLGYALDEPLPDHSSLSRIRERYGLAVFQRFFAAVVEQCRAAGWVWGQERYVDSTDVAAHAAIASLHPRFAVEAHLERLFEAQDEGDVDDAVEASGPTPLPVALTEEARAELAECAADRHDWIGEGGRPDRAKTSGPYRRVADVWASTTDPDASPLRPTGGGADLGDRDHDVVDGGKARVGLSVLVTPAEVQDNQPALDLLGRTRCRWNLHPRQVTGDSKDGTTENVVGIEDQRIRASVPLSEAGRRPGLFADTDVASNAPDDPSRCPGNQTLRLISRCERTRRVDEAPAGSGRACALGEQCTPSRRGRRVGRSFDEDDLERYGATTPRSRTPRRCANGRCGSSRCAPRPRSGTGCTASGFAGCRTSRAKPTSSRPDRT